MLIITIYIIGLIVKNFSTLLSLFIYKYHYFIIIIIFNFKRILLFCYNFIQQKNGDYYITLLTVCYIML